MRHAVIVHRAKSMQSTIDAVMPPLRAACGHARWKRRCKAARCDRAGVPHVTFLIHALAARLTSKVVALDAAKLIRAVKAPRRTRSRLRRSLSFRLLGMALARPQVMLASEECARAVASAPLCERFLSLMTSAAVRTDSSHPCRNVCIVQRTACAKLPEAGVGDESCV